MGFGSLAPGNVPIICQWVYKIKAHFDGPIEHYKGRLVARSFTREYSINYKETFATVAKITRVRVLIALVVDRSSSLYQLDVKNIFLHGDLREEVYIEPPPGLAHPPRMFVTSVALFMVSSDLLVPSLRNSVM